MVASAPCTTPVQSDHVMLLQNNGQQDYTVPMQDKQEQTISEKLLLEAVSSTDQSCFIHNNLINHK